MNPIQQNVIGEIVEKETEDRMKVYGLSWLK